MLASAESRRTKVVVLPEYAKRAGVTQAVMTRILFSLGSRRRGRQAGYDLVQQAPEPEDARTTQTFLTPKGKSFKQLKGRRRHRSSGRMTVMAHALAIA
jgi:DNA-binding MarR family transcriptional regulator